MVFFFFFKFSYSVISSRQLSGWRKKKLIRKIFCILDFFLQHWNSHLTLCDMCSGVSISSNIAPFTLEPLRLASWRSQPDRSQFCKTKPIFTKFGCRVRAFSAPSQNDFPGPWNSCYHENQLFLENFCFRMKVRFSSIGFLFSRWCSGWPSQIEINKG